MPAAEFDCAEISASEWESYEFLVESGKREALDRTFATAVETMRRLRDRGMDEDAIIFDLNLLAHECLVEAGSDARSYLHRSRIMRAVLRQSLRLTRPDRGPRPRDAD